MVHEAESDELRRWLGDSRMVTSRIAIAEVGRAASRLSRQAATNATQVFEGFEVIELDADLAAEVARMGPPILRALDAIHLATALRVRSATGAFVAYDRRLIRAAKAVGLEVVQPGMGAT